jgi:hypothetical protein
MTLVIRYEVYLRERDLTPGTPDWELQIWIMKQRNPPAAVARAVAIMKALYWNSTRRTCLWGVCNLLNLSCWW